MGVITKFEKVIVTWDGLCPGEAVGGQAKDVMLRFMSNQIEPGQDDMKLMVRMHILELTKELHENIESRRFSRLQPQ